MKKKILLLMVIVMLALVGCSSTSSDKANMADYDLLTVENHNYKTGDYETLLKQVNDKVPGIYYFGFASCPWCRELVPVLQQALENTNSNAFYFDVRSNAWTSDINKTFNAYNDTLPETSQSTGFPFIVFVGKDGTVVTHLGTLPTHNAHSREMTADEKVYLLRFLTETINDLGLNG